ncbi:hypothetical protein GCM10007939_07160 [Amylibacter marinus]|uniref:Calcineurin-like phosphoesterase domain-containing protein n=2 Tax=Amylibacter marinus TaxID=1475483 RepID=A0ABQ5VSN2_9RHOB|nr:hypothetical protein GCM10007939_07160 [Amylibacter marinus]
MTGPVLVFGGVYSNLQALTALIARAEAMGVAPQNMICTGDVVAYCADPAACVKRIRELGCSVLMGNCEEQLAQGGDDCGCGFDTGSTCSILSRGWYAHCQDQIGDDDRRWMRELPYRITFDHGGLRYGVVHGAASDISKFIWPVTPPGDIAQECALLRDQVGRFDRVIAGHTGIAMDATREPAGWLNAGAIGMPANDGRSETHFAMLSEGEFTLHTLSYDHQGAAQAMRDVGLTQGYDRCLQSGYWPSEEVLPSVMRSGKK